MSPGSPRVTRRTGGRSARVVTNVLQATLEELGRVGYARLRVDEVAVRSGVNKTTVYRRWPEKPGLICAALRSVGGDPVDPDTGRVRADLIAHFLGVLRGWATERGRGVMRVLAAEGADPVVERLASTLRARYIGVRHRIVARGVTRGELPVTTDVELLVEVLSSAVESRVRRRPGPVDRVWLARVVDFTLGCADVRTTRASAPSVRR